MQLFVLCIYFLGSLSNLNNHFNKLSDGDLQCEFIANFFAYSNFWVVPQYSVSGMSSPSLPYIDEIYYVYIRAFKSSGIIYLLMDDHGPSPTYRIVYNYFWLLSASKPQQQKETIYGAERLLLLYCSITFLLTLSSDF